MRTRLLAWIIGLGTLLVCTFFAWLLWPPGAATETIVSSDRAEGPPTRVILPQAKFDAAGLDSTSVSRQTLHPMRTVPGRIEYNNIQRVDLNVPVESIVREIFVKPGDTVQPGTRLAAFEGPEIGLIRAELDRNRAELEIAELQLAWAGEIAGNLDELLRALSDHPLPRNVEKRFEGRTLGDHRQVILAAYSRYHLAEQLWTDIQPLIEAGSVPAQSAKQRETNTEVAKEEFLSACEQTRFDSQQKRQKAKANRDYAERLVEVSRRKLQTFLGPHSDLSEPDRNSTTNDADLTRFFLVAPFAGTVEQRTVAVAQRLSAGAPAFVVADTSSVWAAADIRERDWDALSPAEGAPVQVKVPALSGREFPGTIEFVGRTVDSSSRAVPLVARLDNRARQLKPGMFVWVSIPVTTAVDALAVPVSALQQHEGHEFVFVDEGAGSFRRVDVQVGLRTSDWVAIDAGLEPEQRVVTRGAFLLKSELLLEREE